MDDDWRIPAFVAQHGDWQPSTNGNPMILAGKLRITVYTEFNGWKFCVAKNTNAKPYFSDSYHLESEAKREAIAFVLRIKSIHKTRKEIRRQDDIKNWRSHLREREQAIAALPEEIVSTAYSDDVTVTKLRALENRIAKMERWSAAGARSMAEYGMPDETKNFLRQAEAFATMLEYVQERISKMKAEARNRKHRPAPRKQPLL